MTKGTPSTGHSMTSSSLDMLHVGLGRSVSVSPYAHAVRPNRNVRVWRRKLCKAVEVDRWLMPLKSLGSSKLFIKAFLRAR